MEHDLTCRIHGTPASTETRCPADCWLALQAGWKMASSNEMNQISSYSPTHAESFKARHSHSADQSLCITPVHPIIKVAQLEESQDRAWFENSNSPDSFDQPNLLMQPLLPCALPESGAVVFTVDQFLIGSKPKAGAVPFEPMTLSQFDFRETELQLLEP